MSRKYALPDFLSGLVTYEAYERWLKRKAQAHVKRDRARGNATAIGESYRLAIHLAVQQSQGRDAYTGEALNWTLISQYDNEESRHLGREYKKRFALLPTVDHVGDGTGEPDFRICGWRTNDAKHDLDLDEFLTLCTEVLRHHGRLVTCAVASATEAGSE